MRVAQGSGVRTVNTEEGGCWSFLFPVPVSTTITTTTHHCPTTHHKPNRDFHLGHHLPDISIRFHCQVKNAKRETNQKCHVCRVENAKNAKVFPSKSSQNAQPHFHILSLPFLPSHCQPFCLNVIIITCFSK